MTALSNACKLYRSKICNIQTYISSQVDLMTKHVCRMFEESQHIVLQKFQIRYDQILSIRQISETMSDSVEFDIRHIPILWIDNVTSHITKLWLRWLQIYGKSQGCMDQTLPNLGRKYGSPRHSTSLRFQTACSVLKWGQLKSKCGGITLCPSL